MDEQSQVYEVVFSGAQPTTVEDYVKDPSSPAAKYSQDIIKFLNVTNNEGISNWDSIIDAYKNELKREQLENTPGRSLPIKIGTKLAIPYEKVERVGLLTQGIEVVSNDIPAFKAQALAKLEQDDKYAAKRKVKLDKGKYNRGKLVEQFPEASVWIWCRALSNSKEYNEGELINLTPFIEDLETNVVKGSGGNFQITLPPLLCEFDQVTKQWIIKKSTFKQYKSSTGDAQYVAQGQAYDEFDQDLKRSQFFFHNIISSNDIVWIRFESLNNEVNRSIDENNLFIDKSKLPNNIYDMIGLVDSNKQEILDGANSTSIVIDGRDLIKLFLEDGTYFYALEMSQGQMNFVGGSTQLSELMQRNFANNALLYLGLYYNNSIENVFKFVIQQLSSIKVAPNELFEGYGERRNTRYIPEYNSASFRANINDQLTIIRNKGIEIVKSIRKQSEISLPSLDQESTKCQEIWEQLIHFFSEIRRLNIRVIQGNLTVGWNRFNYVSQLTGSETIENNIFPQYFFGELHMTQLYNTTTAHKLNDDTIVLHVDEFLDLQQSTKGGESDFEKEIAPGIWSIIKLVIDKGISNRRIVDSSASSSNGALINFIRKVCQEPFVEFYSDTYEDMFYLIARKPPYDKQGLRSMLGFGEGVNTEEQHNQTGLQIVEIELEDIIKEELQYDDSQIFSWYRFVPMANFIGSSNDFSLAYLPAIYLPEYAEIWGSRPLELMHNYMPHIPLTRSGDLDITEKQAFEDMKYIIESTAYLPFTRRGAIVLNGDRRIKVGNIIRYKPTGEIFFVDTVKQNYSISGSKVERTTTITVSRGMYEDGITGTKQVIDEDGEPFYPSYFDIVNTELTITEKQPVSQIISAEDREPEIYTLPLTTSDQYLYNNLELRSIFSTVNQYKGYKYGLGSKGQDGKIDCSGFVTAVLKSVSNISDGKNSEDLLVGSNNLRKVSTLRVEDLQPGDIIGVDTGKKFNKEGIQWDGDRIYGIDHVLIVMLNYNTQQLEIAESKGGRNGGVKTTPINIAIRHYNNIAKSIWVGDYRNPPMFPSSGTVMIDGKQAIIVSDENPIQLEEVIVGQKNIDRSKVFSKVKVNQKVFNFFLRRRQNNELNNE